MTPGRLITSILLLLAAVYCGTTAYPSLLFNGVHQSGNIAFYTKEPASEAEPLFSRVSDSVASGYPSEADKKFEVYIAGSDKEYLFFAPFCWKHRSCVHPVSGKVFIAPSDLASNTAYDFGTDHAARSLNGVIVHELVKAQLRSKLGLAKYILLPDWKKDGYAEHIAMETAAISPSVVCGDGIADKEIAGLLKARLMVEMLASEDGENDSAIMGEDHSYELLNTRLMKKYCKDL